MSVTRRDAAMPETRKPSSLEAASSGPRRHGFPQRLVSKLGDYSELCKVRVGLLVLLTAAVGYVLACRFFAQPADLSILGHLLWGTALLSGGSAACNQILERNRDVRMQRTRQRPVAAGRLPVAEATIAAGLLLTIGLIHLSWFVQPLTAVVGAVTGVSYVFLYTPLKSRTHLSTVVGAVPGALPPVMGWSAVHGSLDGPAWSIFAILFIWQLPHFLAIAWLYRADYARGGFPMLTVVDPSGAAMARQVVVNSAALVPVSLLPALVGVGGVVYFWSALTLGVTFFVLGVWMAWRRTQWSARVLLLASIVYLALLFVALLLDGVVWTPAPA